MESTQITKQQWTALFAQIGLSEQQMHAWHVAFEERHPDAHAAFLVWLGIEAEEIEQIRTRARQG